MFILDATALGALFHVPPHPPIFDVWSRADREEVTIGIPTTAIVEAAQRYDVERSAWDAVLMSPMIEVLDLTQAVAVEIGSWQGLLHARHALWESQQLGWPILTRDGGLYVAGSRVLVV